MHQGDVVIIGAGAAGLMCARVAGLRGRRVVVLDHASTLGQKILISGGGRCNFTNLGAGPANYVSANPHFCRSALARFTPEDFLALIHAHHIPFYEKKLGQLFCETSAKAIVQLLRTECERVNVVIQLDTKITRVERVGDSAAPLQDPANAACTTTRFHIHTSRGTFSCAALVIATGGLSLPKLGATGFGYDLAQQFDLAITPRAPALDGFVFTSPQTEQFQGLQGIARDVDMGCGDIQFHEAVLFTHHGLSGPVALQTSLHWNVGDSVWINWFPTTDVAQLLTRAQKTHAQKHPKNWLADFMPDRLATALAAIAFPHATKLAQVTGAARDHALAALTRYTFTPISTVGYAKAEVTRGGIDTGELSSKTMEAKKIPGLFFIGEVVDVTGWLGGYNFQWAWASGSAAGEVV